MTDRKQLELAAKAAGIEYNFICPTGAHCGDINTTQNRFWNPLTDDGDALRLAVKLNLAVQIEGEYSIASNFSGRISENQDHGNDPYAATRRAIVMAAVEIGRGIKQHIVGDVPEDNYYKTQAEAEELARSEIGRE
jgi:hypothetical protein